MKPNIIPRANKIETSLTPSIPSLKVLTTYNIGLAIDIDLHRRLEEYLLSKIRLLRYIKGVNTKVGIIEISSKLSANTALINPIKENKMAVKNNTSRC